MVNEEKKEVSEITLLARKDARKRLLEALNDFDPQQDKEKIEKVKSTLAQINSEIKELSQKITITEKSIITPPMVPSKKTLKEIDDSKNNLQKEIVKLRDEISHERKQWEEKLFKKHRELNSIKAKMNLRQAQLRAEYQLKKQELERTRDDLEEKLRGGTFKETTFSDERKRWTKRLSDKQEIIDSLKVELSLNESKYNNEIKEIRDDYSQKIASLEEIVKNLKEQIVRKTTILKSDLHKRQRRIIELQQQIGLKVAAVEHMRAAHQMEINSIKFFSKDERSRIIETTGKTESRLKEKIAEGDDLVRKLKEDIAALNEGNINLQKESKFEVENLNKKNESILQEYKQQIDNHTRLINELKDEIVNDQKDNAISLNTLEKEKENIINEFNWKLSEKEKNIINLKDEISNLSMEHKKEYDELQIKISIREKEIKLLEEKKNKEIEKQNHIIENLKIDLNGIRGELDSVKLKKDNQKKEFKITIEKEISLKSALEKSLNDIIHQKERKISELGNDISNLTKSKEDLKNLLEEDINNLTGRYNSEIKENNRQIEDLKSLNIQINEQLSIERATRAEENKSWAEKSGEKQSRLNELAHRLDVKSNQAEKLEVQLKEQNLKNEEEKNIFNIKISVLKDDIAEKGKNYSAQTESLKEKINALIHEKNYITQDYSNQLQKLNNLLDEEKITKKNLSEEYKNEKAAILSSLRDTDERYEKKKDDLNTTLNELNAERHSNEDLLKELDDLKNSHYKDNKIFKEKLGEKDSKIVEITSDIQIKNSLIKKLENQIKEQVTKNEQAKDLWMAEIAKLKDEISEKEKNYQGTIERADEKINSLNKEKDFIAEQSFSRIENLEQQLSEEKIIKKDLSEEYKNEKVAILLSLRNADERYEKKKDDLNTTLNELNTERHSNEILSNELRGIKQLFVESKRNFVEELRDNVEKHSATRQVLQNNITELKKELEGLSKNYDIALKDHDEKESYFNLKNEKKNSAIRELKSEIHRLNLEGISENELKERKLQELKKNYENERNILLEKIVELKNTSERRISSLTLEKEAVKVELKNKLHQGEIIIKNLKKDKDNEIKKLNEKTDETIKILREDYKNLADEFSKKKEILNQSNEDVKKELTKKMWEVNKVREELENILKEFEERVATQRQIWEEKLKNKEEQIRALREDSESNKNSLSERIDELKDANWKIQVQLEDDRKKWRKIFDEKEKEYRALKLDKEKRERELVEELAVKESLWLQEKGEIQRQLNKIESTLKSELPRREEDIEKLKIELSDSKKQLEEEMARHSSEIQQLKEEMKLSLTEMDLALKKLEDDNLKIKSHLSQRESELITTKSRYENEISILEDKLHASTTKLEEELKSLKIENSQIKSRVSDKVKLLNMEREEKKEEVSEIRKRLEKNLENFRMRLENIGINSSQGSIPADGKTEKVEEEIIPPVISGSKVELNRKINDIKKAIKNNKIDRRVAIREKESEYRSAATGHEKDRLRKELMGVEKIWQERESNLRDQLSKFKKMKVILV